ncbi:MAG: quinone oxidoreductase family protein [Acidimicrobiales bacterium]
MRAVRVDSYGGPEVLEVVDVDPPRLGENQVLVEVAAAGVNFMDTYQREGVGGYSPPLPFLLGAEGAGRVSGVGSGVTGFSIGDRVAWKSARGSYAEQVLASSAELVQVPEGVPDEWAAAVLLQGMTAHYLVTSTYPVRAGDTVLVHAAAGGVGLLLTQMVKLMGGRVIGTVSTAEKEALARSAGADHVVRYDKADVAEAVRELTGGEGVAAVYDGVGRSTFDASLASLRPRGYLVLYGASSGQVPPFDLQRLNSGGSLFVTRPSLGHYTASREELMERARYVLGWVADGRLVVHVGGRYPLEEVRRAHQDLEARRTTGKLLLLPR